MNPWQRLYEQLSGTLFGGFALYLFLFIAAWFIWIFVYRYSGVIGPKDFRKWGFLITFALVALYATQRVRHPAPIAPLRVWVQPFETVGEGSVDANLARFSVERCLYDATERFAPFQTLDMDTSLLHPSPAENAGVTVPGAMLVHADYSITGEVTNVSELIQLKLKVQSLDWEGRILASYPVTVEGADAAEAGRKAVESILRALDMPVARGDRLQELAPPVLEALYRNSITASFAEREAILKEGFTRPDTSEVPLWEALAELYLAWNFPEQADQAHEAARHALLLNDQSSVGYRVNGTLVNRENGDVGEAVASWKLGYLYDRRSDAAILELAGLPADQIRELRIGNKEQILVYALRIRPSNSTVRMALAKYWRDDRRNYDLALKIVEDGLALNPAQSRLRMMKVSLIIPMKRFDEAETMLRQLLAEDSSNTAALFNLGIVQRRRGQLDDALATFRKVTELHGPIDAFYYLGLIYEQKNDRENALKNYRWRWALRSGRTDDYFALAARERIRLVISGKTLLGNVLPGYKPPTGGEESSATLQELQKAAEIPLPDSLELQP